MTLTDAIVSVRLAVLFTCIVAAAIIALAGKQGWGWFLFVAVILVPTLP